MTKKVLSMFLVVAMLLTLAPVMVFADPATTEAPGGSFADLQAIIDAANDGDTIKLTSDLKLTKQLEISKAITLDGNGKKIDGSGVSGKGAILVTAGATLKNIEAQIIDDTKGATLVASSSMTLKLENGSNVEAAAKVGKALAEAAKAKKISTVVFDRGGYVYHGRVAALADAAREGGLKF